MKRLMALLVGCLLLGLGGVTGVFGQKKGDLIFPDLKEIPGLIKQLGDENAGTRTKAAELLGKAGMRRSRDIKGAIPALLKMVKDESDVNARRAAAGALGYASPEPKDAVPILINAVKEDKDFGVKIAAASALGYFGPEGKEAIPVLREAVDAAKAADKDEKDKRNLGKAAQGALKLITGSNK
ncbi:MAG: HEAT repeat domain-containing protein [Planctomycetia bacterium]|nr:HEAT repeat domain-containing protein [Planctomycetia bacterium]